MPDDLLETEFEKKLYISRLQCEKILQDEKGSMCQVCHQGLYLIKA